MEIYEMTHIYFELLNHQKKNCGCLRYEELSTKYIYSFNPHLPTYVTSTIPNTSVSTCLTEKTSTKLFLWKEDV